MEGVVGGFSQQNLILTSRSFFSASYLGFGTLKCFIDIFPRTFELKFILVVVLFEMLSQHYSVSKALLTEFTLVNWRYMNEFYVFTQFRRVAEYSSTIAFLTKRCMSDDYVLYQGPFVISLIIANVAVPAL